MDTRLDYTTSEILRKFVKHLNAASAAVPRGTLPVATINAYNRFNVICQNQGGDYQPGQWGGRPLWVAWPGPSAGAGRDRPGGALARWAVAGLR